MIDRKLKEVYRKSIHLGSLILPFSYRYIFHYNRKQTFIFLVPITLVFLIIEIVRMEHRTVKRLFYNIFGIMLRKHEMHEFTGAAYLLISAIICIAVFPRNIAFLALSFLAIGDTFAAVIGIIFGKRKLLHTKKSLEGSLACFISSFVFALFFINPTVAFFGALTAAIAELSRIPVDDNIKIPISAGLIMSVIGIFV